MIASALARLRLRGVWREPARKLRTLESFAATEEDGGRDLEVAAVRGARRGRLRCHAARRRAPRGRALPPAPRPEPRRSGPGGHFRRDPEGREVPRGLHRALPRPLARRGARARGRGGIASGAWLALHRRVETSGRALGGEPLARPALPRLLAPRLALRAGEPDDSPPRRSRPGPARRGTRVPVQPVLMRVL